MLLIGAGQLAMKVSSVPFQRLGALPFSNDHSIHFIDHDDNESMDIFLDKVDDGESENLEYISAGDTDDALADDFLKNLDYILKPAISDEDNRFQNDVLNANEEESDLGMYKEHVDVEEKLGLYQSEEIPNLSVFDNVEYPTNIQYFHDDMPKIADKMDGMDLALLDDAIWKMEDSITKQEAISDMQREAIYSIFKSESGNKMKKTPAKGKKSVRFKKPRNRKPAYKDPEYSHIIHTVNDDLVKKLAQGSKRESSIIPWKYLKREDLINWPENIPIKRIIQQGKKNLDVLYSNLDRITFSKEFLDRWAISKNLGREEEINDNLLTKINVGANIREIPWSDLKREDLIHWPVNVPVSSLLKLTRNDLDSVYENVHRIKFTQEFFRRWNAKRTALVKKPSISVTHDGDFVSQNNISPVIQNLISAFSPKNEDTLKANKASLVKPNRPYKDPLSTVNRQSLLDTINFVLLSKLNIATESFHKFIPWAGLMEGDLVNWPLKTRLVVPSSFGLSTLLSIAQNLDRIYFSKAAIDRLDRNALGRY